MLLQVQGSTEHHQYTSQPVGAFSLHNVATSIRPAPLTRVARRQEVKKELSMMGVGVHASNPSILRGKAGGLQV